MPLDTVFYKKAIYLRPESAENSKKNTICLLLGTVFYKKAIYLRPGSAENNKKK